MCPKGLTLLITVTALVITLFALEMSFWMPVLSELAALFTKVLIYEFKISMRSFVAETWNKLTVCVAVIKSPNAACTINSKKHKKVDRYMSTAKLITASITVSARTSTSLAPDIVSLTARANCLLVAMAR